MRFEKIIVLDDEMIIRKTLGEQLRKRRYSVATAENIAEARELLSRDQFDLMFVDSRLPDGNGIELLKQLSGQPDSPLVVMITGYGSIESAVECMQLGAFDYLIKPFSTEQIDLILKKAESYNQLVKVNQYFVQEQQETGKLIGNSPEINNLKRMVKKVAATEATVLITGENGTGKELIAQELYKQSPLSKKPYIRVNCAAISENLIESEFFGHEKGAFTGATQRREGRFELANGGTILLDEIGEISPQVQVKLLRVLQEREFERVGGNKTISVNVRVLATTNRNLLEAVERGEFREDLYYRLNVFPIHVMPLRERKSDIPLLASEFLKSFTRRHGIELPGFAQATLNLLLEHDWPGNVRELQNTIERAVIMAEPGRLVEPHALGLMSVCRPRQAVRETPMPATLAGTVRQRESDLAASRNAIASANSEARIVSPEEPELPRDERSGSPASERLIETPGSYFEESDGTAKTLEEMEKMHILHTLEKTSGNRTQAANMLKISIRTLRNKIHQYRDEGVLVP